MRVLLTLVAVMMIIAGGLWTAQALGWVQGGSMQGSQLWATLGPILAGLGVALLYVVVRGPQQR